MKNALVILSVLLINITSFSKSLIDKLEAESGTYSGVNISTNNNGYSGTGYLTNFNEASDYVTFTIEAPEEGTYDLEFRYRSEYGDKYQNLHINGILINRIKFPNNSSFSTFYAGQIELKKGNNTISVYSDWGYIDLDFLEVYTSEPHDYSNVASSLIDPNASIETVALYEFLKNNYGSTIISGQNFHWDELIEITSKSPLLQSFDLQNYSPMNPWGSENNVNAFKAYDDGTLQSIAKWQKSNDFCGIVSLQWHWFSPSGGNLRTSTFYSENTTFDVSKAVQEGTTEYDEVIRDIDAIAIQLQRLEELNIPILWRPLHEAGGSWFWWGAKGPEPVKALWDIMYDRITNYHDIHNLIWVWSAHEENYYLGNDKLDILGYDSYPNKFDYSSQKIIFDQLYNMSDGEKILAMTENGPIPDAQQCFDEDAKWAYFCSWDDLVETNNSVEHINYTFNHSLVSTLDEKCAISSVINYNETSLKLYPNPVSTTLIIEGLKVDSWEVISLTGVSLKEGKGNKPNIEDLETGIYFLKINGEITKRIMKD